MIILPENGFLGGYVLAPGAGQIMVINGMDLKETGACHVDIRNPQGISRIHCDFNYMRETSEFAFTLIDVIYVSVIDTILVKFKVHNTENVELGKYSHMVKSLKIAYRSEVK